MKAILSPDGTVIPDESNNTLIIVDEPGVLKKAGELVASSISRHGTCGCASLFLRPKIGVRSISRVRWRYNDGGFAIGNYRDGHGGEGLWVAATPKAMETSGTSVTNQDLLIVSGESGRFVPGLMCRLGMMSSSGSGGAASFGRKSSFARSRPALFLPPRSLIRRYTLILFPSFPSFVDEKEGSIVVTKPRQPFPLPTA